MTEEKRRIPYLAPFISEEAVAAAVSVLHSDEVDKGPVVDEFEGRFKNLVNAPYAVSTNSCTSALHLSLIVAGVVTGDEVITTPLTYSASNMAILYTGAKPVFADIRPDTFNIDPDDIKRKITYKTKAILVVHLGGQPADLDEIHKIARDNDLLVIEDAAQAHGATYKGRLIGALSDLTCFSFDPYKPLPAGAGGGMITTTNADFDARLRRLRYYGFQEHHGGDYYKKYASAEIGMKYYMKPISAAMANANLVHFHEMVKWRRQVAHRYIHELNDVPGLRIMQMQMDRVSSYYTLMVIIDRRSDFFEKMHAEGIMVGLPAVRNDIAPIFGGKRLPLPVLNRIEHRFAGLPVHNRLTNDDVTRVIRTIRKSW